MRRTTKSFSRSSRDNKRNAFDPRYSPYLKPTELPKLPRNGGWYAIPPGDSPSVFEGPQTASPQLSSSARLKRLVQMSLEQPPSWETLVEKSEDACGLDSTFNAMSLERQHPICDSKNEVEQSQYTGAAGASSHINESALPEAGRTDVEPMQIDGRSDDDSSAGRPSS